jgi:NADP-dependent 3-hydroxy acid dehydrogenase YdfG
MSKTLFDLSGKVALVTGTSRGLGQYFARALALAGADIAMTSRDKKQLSTFANEIRDLGRQTLAIDLDVRDYSSIQNAIAGGGSILRSYRYLGQQCRMQHSQGCAKCHLG